MLQKSMQLPKIPPQVNEINGGFCITFNTPSKVPPKKWVHITKIVHDDSRVGRFLINKFGVASKVAHGNLYMFDLIHIHQLGGMMRI